MFLRLNWFRSKMLGRIRIYINVKRCFYAMLLAGLCTCIVFIASIETVPRFVDEYFEPILNIFKNKTFEIRRSQFRSGSIPKIYVLDKLKLSGTLWKNSFHHITANECPHRCTFTEDLSQYSSSDAVLVFMSHIKNVSTLLNEEVPNRDLAQPWILLLNECPQKATIPSFRIDSLNGVFNRTMFYRSDSDIPFVHGFVVSKQDARYLPSSWHVNAPPIQKLPFHERKPIIGFVSDCTIRGGRMGYIDELKKHMPVDIVGGCGNLKCGISRYVTHEFRVERDKCLLGAAQRYLFFLSFENNICEEYVTEKLYNILYYPIVPVVFGGAEYEKIMPPDSYIDALQFTGKELADHLLSIAADQERYESMLSWRNHYEVSTVGLQRIYCQLCTKLYNPSFYEENVYTDFYSWFVNKSNCKHFVAGDKTIHAIDDFQSIVSQDE